MRDQAYHWYWTPEWQADEQESVAALDRGEGLRFRTAREAIEWLMADDPDRSAEDSPDAGGPPPAPGTGGPSHG